MSEQQDAASDEPVAGFAPPTVEELAALLPHYHIDYLIASGGMGAVYRGLQIDLDRPVAIKVLPPEASTDSESINRFRSEARAMAKLNHSNIVSIYDFGVVEGQGYFVMEFVEGRNLYELISTKQVTPEMAMRVMNQVCDSLIYAHSKGIVHGDIKPSNIVMDEDGNVKLLDFGLARLMEHGHHDENWTPMGTPEYAAPELYERDIVADHRADLYALGVIFYEMLMGAVPQGSYSLPTTVLQIDPRVDEIIVRCLRPEPENRYQNATEIKQVLEDIRLGKPIAPTPDALRPASLRPVTLVRPSVRRGPAQPPKTTGRSAVDRIRVIEMEQKERQKKTMMIGGGIALAVAIVAAAVAMSMMGKSSAPTADQGGNKPAKKPKEEPIRFSPIQPDAPKPEPPKPEPPKPKPAPAPETPSTVKNDSPADPPAEKPKDPVPMPKPEGDSGTAKVAPPSPPPPTPPADPPSGERYPALSKLKADYVQRYKTEVVGRIEGATKDLGDKYIVQLGKLEAEYLNKADAGSVLQIREEKDRFEKSRQEPPLSKLSKIEKLAKLQGILINAYENARRGVAPTISKLNSDFSEGLLKLQNQLAAEGKGQESDATKELREDGMKIPDYLAVLAGLRPAPPGRNKGEIAPGNVALAKNGATADGGTNPAGLLDGIAEREASGYTLAGDSFTVTLPKVYKLAKVVFFLSENEDYSFHYILEGSADGSTWVELENRSTGENLRGKQELTFRPQPIKALRLKVVDMVGTDRFVVKELEAYCDVP